MPNTASGQARDEAATAALNWPMCMRKSAAAESLGKIGQAGVIAQGSTVKIKGGEAPTGWFPRFAATGKTDYRYYIVARHAKIRTLKPSVRGRALTNGAGNIVVTTADIGGATSFDLLRVTAIERTA